MYFHTRNSYVQDSFDKMLRFWAMICFSTDEKYSLENLWIKRELRARETSIMRLESDHLWSGLYWRIEEKSLGYDVII